MGTLILVYSLIAAAMSLCLLIEKMPAIMERANERRFYQPRKPKQ